MSASSSFRDRIRQADMETVKAGIRRANRFAAYSSGLPRLINRFRARRSRDVLFIWVPKAAGTSIYNWLHAEIGMLKLKEPFAVRGGFPGRGPVTFGHMDVSLLIERGLVKETFVDHALCFALVRNPFSRAVSLYKYLHERRRVTGDLTDFLEVVAQGVEAVGLYNSVGLSQANPQCRWLFRRSGHLFPHKIWKVEELEQRIPEIRACIGVEHAPAFLNKSSGRVPELSGRDIDLIRSIYEEDFERLGYSVDPKDCVVA
ncbi:MAG: hypothetical protein CVT80_03535 [Alphaproteobacteria bacterium HGW-Alphaproteobacteria-2]|nr:MAG: hypothetical protein CVT80_03535 [Alphaproteobacteria bacterium HGW-Alphaproteobacteria-2]